jgi:hypothetical protein
MTPSALIPCRRCGYNLIGSRTDGQCPECGTPVAFSRRSDQLCDSDPGWVNTLGLGARLSFWAVIALIAVVICYSGGRGGRVPAEIGSMASQGLYLVGTWLLTTPDPSGLGEDRYGTARRAARWAVPFSVAGLLAGFVSRTAITPATVASALAGIERAGGFADVFGLTMTLSYIGRLAARTADYRLEERANTLVGWLGVPLLLLLSVTTVMNQLHLARGGWVGLVLGGGACLCALPVLFGGPMYFFMLRRLNRALQDEQSVAQRSWAAPPLAAARPGP